MTHLMHCIAYSVIQISGREIVSEILHVYQTGRRVGIPVEHASVGQNKRLVLDVGAQSSVVTRLQGDPAGSLRICSEARSSLYADVPVPYRAIKSVSPFLTRPSDSRDRDQLAIGGTIVQLVMCQICAAVGPVENKPVMTVVVMVSFSPCRMPCHAESCDNDRYGEDLRYATDRFMRPEPPSRSANPPVRGGTDVILITPPFHGEFVKVYYML